MHSCSVDITGLNMLLFGILTLIDDVGTSGLALGWALIAFHIKKIISK